MSQSNWTLVAKVRSTPKGKTTVINGIETPLSKPNVGKDARRVWNVEKAGPSKWRCNCPSFRYHMHGKPCKHMLKLFNEYRIGTILNSEITIVREDLLKRAKRGR